MTRRKILMLGWAAVFAGLALLAYGIAGIVMTFMNL